MAGEVPSPRKSRLMLLLFRTVVQNNLESSKKSIDMGTKFSKGDLIGDSRDLVVFFRSTRSASWNGSLWYRFRINPISFGETISLSRGLKLLSIARLYTPTVSYGISVAVLVPNKYLARETGFY